LPGKKKILKRGKKADLEVTTHHNGEKEKIPEGIGAVLGYGTPDVVLFQKKNCDIWFVARGGGVGKVK